MAVQALRILVVDDDPNLLYILSRFLETDNHRVTGCTTGEAAIETFCKNPTDFDLLITDLTLPDRDGWEIADQVKALRPEVQVMLITGWVEELDEKKLSQHRIACVINKPYRFDEVQKAIASLFQT